MKEFKGSEIRNIAVVGHGASGKTSLVDALAFVSGASKRHGVVKDGTSLTDTAPEEIAGRSVTTIEGLSETSSHPVQKAWLAERVPQCGYCQSGQIMSAADLLAHNPKPDRAQIVEHMSTNICRCGSYPRIVRAIERAAKEA